MLCLFDVEFPGRVRRLDFRNPGQDIPARRLARLAGIELSGHCGPVGAKCKSLPDCKIGKEWVRRVLLCSFSVDLCVRVREVDQNPLDRGSRDDDEFALAALGFHLLENGLLDLKVPGVVPVPRLENGLRRRGRIATAFEIDRGEEWLVRLPIMLVDRVNDLVIFLERVYFVRSGSSRSNSERIMLLNTALEHVLWINCSVGGAGEWNVPRQHWRREVDLDRQVIRSVNAGNDGVRGLVDRRIFRIDNPFPSEFDIGGGEGLTIVPE